jgi:hypothetical protein
MIKLEVIDIDLIIKKLNEIKSETEEKLNKRRLDMADQNGPNVSRYITATRWMVEQEIEDLDKEVIRLDKGIKEIKSLMNDKKRIGGKYFVSDNFEYIELGIISKKSGMGQKILEAKT